MSGPSERDPGVTGRSSPGQYANTLILCERWVRRRRLRLRRLRLGATNLHIAQ